MSHPDGNAATDESPIVGTEIKRSSWSAGTTTDFSQPPPGSPASWQIRKNRNVGHNSLSNNDRSINNAASPSYPLLVAPKVLGSNSPRPRSHSPLRNYIRGPTLEPIRSVSGSALGSDIQVDEAPSNDSSFEPIPNPFKFTSTYVTPTVPRSSASRANQRRGHHYKHSSVSVNFFQEPEELAPLSLPVSLAVPNLVEYWQSITTQQSVKLAWCGVRLAVTIFSYTTVSHINSMSLLAHLLAYETLVSSTIASAEVLANFEVWKKSSLRFPFALKRVEVLAAFGLAVVLLFIAGDIISHTIQHFATDGQGHQHHFADQTNSMLNSIPQKSNWRNFLVLVFSICIAFPTVWKQGCANPLALCTLIVSLVILMIPVLPTEISGLIDNCILPIVILAMIYVGYTSSKLFGGMLAMSYGGPDRSHAIREIIRRDSCVIQVDDISLWQIHHDLWLASMMITMSGTADDEKRVRQHAVTAVKEAVDVKDIDWETTIEIHRA